MEHQLVDQAVMFLKESGSTIITYTTAVLRLQLYVCKRSKRNEYTYAVSLSSTDHPDRRLASATSD